MLNDFFTKMIDFKGLKKNSGGGKGPDARDISPNSTKKEFSEGKRARIERMDRKCPRAAVLGVCLILLYKNMSSPAVHGQLSDSVFLCPPSPRSGDFVK